MIRLVSPAPLRAALRFWFLLALGGPHPAFGQVSGIVRELDTLAPIPGALITLQATRIRTATGPDGTFDLSGAAGDDLVIVGAHAGYFNRSVRVTTPASGVVILLDRVPPDDNPNYTMISPNGCGACHVDQHEQWFDSPMNLAGSNVWVYDTYDGTGTPGGMGGFVYTRDSAHAPANPASECAACHQPEPWIQKPFSALEDIRYLSDGALHGVSCEVCHKVAHIDETRINFPGIYPGVVTVTRPAGPVFHQVQYGVLGDADYSFPELMRASYQPQLRAAVCAACHQDKNDPDGDGDFEEENGVISEPTYLEWLASPYGDPTSRRYQDCVDCHMPAYGATTVCSILNPPLERDPETIRHHRITGTTAEYLENAVEMTLDAERLADRVEARIVIRNTRTGHHVPTGVTIRNMILLVEAWRESDGEPLAYLGAQTIHELGGIGDPAQGYYAGLPGKFFAKVNHDAQGQGPVFFTDATGILFDNRIPALAADTTRYTFAAPAGDGALHVRGRLIYRRSFRRLTDLKQWTVDGHGQALVDLSPPHFGHLMEAAEWVSSPTGIGSTPAPTTARLTLDFAPHPAAPQTMIRFELPSAARVKLLVYDLTGRSVGSLVDQPLAAGPHAISWSGIDGRGQPIASGIYVVRLEAGRQSTSRRLIVLK